jgi:hypothetical protein
MVLTVEGESCLLYLPIMSALILGKEGEMYTSQKKSAKNAATAVGIIAWCA